MDDLKKKEMLKNLKKKYVRSIIKLGNSKAITFPQEWTKLAELKDKSEIKEGEIIGASEVSLYPIDDKSILIRVSDKEREQTVLRLNGNKWPLKLIKQAIISAFKINVDEIYVKYNEDNQEDLYELLINLQREIIGFDFKNLSDTQDYYINFLLDTSKAPFQDVLMDLANIFHTIIKNVIEGTNKKSNNLLLTEIGRKYSLGRRILVTGLSEYPTSKGYRNMPVIQFLGNRVVLLYVRDFINESLNLHNFSKDIIAKYSDLLSRIPSLLISMINNYDNINLKTISEVQDDLINLDSILDKIHLGETFEELEIRNTIKYFLNSFQTFFDIGITRLIEFEIGMI